MLRNAIVITLLLVAGKAYPQDEVQNITEACQASLRQLVFWCVTLGQAENAVPSPIEREKNCGMAKQRSDRYCYTLQIPQLACTSALQEMEMWCGGNAKFNMADVVSFCEESQRNVRLFCYR